MAEFKPIEQKAVKPGDVVDFDCKWTKSHLPIEVWVAPCRGGIKFWERSRWKFNNPAGDLEDGYTELSSILLDLCENTILHDGYPIRDSFIVGMHDESGYKYIEYVSYYGDEDSFLSESDWQEAQNEMYLDWVMPISFNNFDLAYTILSVIFGEEEL